MKFSILTILFTLSVSQAFADTTRAANGKEHKLFCDAIKINLEAENANRILLNPRLCRSMRKKTLVLRTGKRIISGSAYMDTGAGEKLVKCNVAYIRRADLDTVINLTTKSMCE